MGAHAWCYGALPGAKLTGKQPNVVQTMTNVRHKLRCWMAKLILESRGKAVARSFQKGQAAIFSTALTHSKSSCTLVTPDGSWRCRHPCALFTICKAPALKPSRWRTLFMIRFSLRTTTYSRVSKNLKTVILPDSIFVRGQPTVHHLSSSSSK